MKNLKFNLLIISFFLFSCGTSYKIEKKKVELSSTIKVLNINLKHSLNSKSAVKKLANAINQSQCEILFIQQIEESKGNDFNPVKNLSKTLDWNYHFGTARYFNGMNSGNAIFSPYPIQQRNVQNLPVSKGKIRRSFTFGVIDVGLMELNCISTEIDNEAKLEREKQAKKISQFYEKNSERRFLMGGSFYLSEDEETEKILSEKFFANTEKLSNDLRIFVSNSDRIKIESTKIFSTPLGDALLSEIKINQ